MTPAHKGSELQGMEQAWDLGLAQRRGRLFAPKPRTSAERKTPELALPCLWDPTSAVWCHLVTMSMLAGIIHKQPLWSLAVSDPATRLKTNLVVAKLAKQRITHSRENQVRSQVSGTNQVMLVSMADSIGVKAQVQYTGFTDKSQ